MRHIPTARPFHSLRIGDNKLNAGASGRPNSIQIDHWHVVQRLSRAYVGDPPRLTPAGFLVGFRDTPESAAEELRGGSPRDLTRSVFILFALLRYLDRLTTECAHRTMAGRRSEKPFAQTSAPHFRRTGFVMDDSAWRAERSHAL